MPTYNRTAIDEADVAYNEVGGIGWRMYVWLGKETDEYTVESALFVVQEHGQEVLRWRKQVQVPGAGDTCDCPKVVAHGNYFILHWLEGARAGTPNIERRSYLLTSGGPGEDWVDEGTSSTHSTWLYDVAKAEGHADYVLTHHASATTVYVARYNGPDWVDTVWTATYTRTIDNRVLTIAAHRTDDDVVIAFQDDPGGAAPNTMAVHRRVFETGAAGGDWNALLAAPDSDYTEATLARVSSRTWLLVVEAEIDSVAGEYFVAYEKQNVNTGAVSGSEQLAYNVRLLSRAWAYANHANNGATCNVYAVLGFSSRETDYDQLAAYVCNFDVDKLASATDQTMRPRIVCNLNDQLVNAVEAGRTPNQDAEPAAAGRRMNHLSSAAKAPTFGPDVKSRTVALPVFTRLIASGATALTQPIVPVQTSILGFKCHIEEPWIVYRDDTDPAAPTLNAKTAYPWSPFQSIEIGDMLFISGGTPSVYDGSKVVELGFPWFPEVAPIEAAGSAIGAGTYTYTAQYEWRDDAGHLHRSAPALPVSLTLSGGGNDNATVDVTTMTMVVKDQVPHYSDARDVSVVLYRTANGGSIFYRVYGVADPAAPRGIAATPANDPTTYQITIGDDVADSTLVNHDILDYQLVDGAWTPLPPIMPPAFLTACKWQGRIVGFPCIDTGTVWYSLQVLPEQGGVALTVPEFNPVNTFRLEGDTDVVAAIALDEYLIVFTRSGFYRVTGVLNDDTGAGAQIDQQWTPGVGCIEPRSLCVTPKGLFFQSERGIHLMDRAGSVDNVSIGSLVEDDVSLAGNIRAATYIERLQQVRFVANAAVEDDPTVLVLDLFHMLWTRYTLPLGDQNALSDSVDWSSSNVSGCEWRGAQNESLHVVLQQSAIFVERAVDDANLYKDEWRANDGGTDTLSERVFIKTGWISVAEYKRVREVGLYVNGITGGGDFSLSITMDYEVAGTYDSTNTDTWTVSAPLTSDYIRLRPRIQKLTAFRLTITEAGVASTRSDFSISKIVMKVGKYPGPRRPPDTQIAT